MLKLYNTLTRKKEAFKPVKDKEVRMYVCGPTVNDIPHLGHARQQITFDVLRKYFIFLGNKVKFVSNITDIEDKIINKANELKIPIEELTERNTKAHMEDYVKLRIKKPDVQPKATEYISQMLNLIKKLEEKKYTYIIKGDGVYFNIAKFKKYGQLSHQNLKELKAGARVKAKSEKKNEEDFVLWKFSKEGEPSWNSPWGPGRPGWHIECSAMSQSILGLPIDIHGGGQDLIFPHHEDEKAQSEAAYEKKFVNYWVHNGMVNINKVKMSKSLGNFTTIRDILKSYSGEVIRYFVITTQYRKPIDFSKEKLEAAKNAYQRLKNITQELKDDKKINEQAIKDFKKAMDDDLNTPQALQILWNLLRDQEARGKISTIKQIDSVFDLGLLEKEKKLELQDTIKSLVEEREKARKSKNWAEADKIRDKLRSWGFVIEDKPEGPKVTKIA